MDNNTHLPNDSFKDYPASYNISSSANFNNYNIEPIPAHLHEVNAHRYTASAPASSNVPANINFSDVRRIEYMEEEDRTDYYPINSVLREIPDVSVPEKIIICMDPCLESAGHVLKSKDGSNQENLLNICKNVVEMFISTKLALDRHHQFGLITLLKSATWIRDFTSNRNELISDIRHMDHNDLNEDVFDLSSLFDNIQQRLVLPNPPPDHTTQIPPHVVRVLFMYCRSNCIPIFLNGRDSQYNMLQSPYFFFDVIYVHKPANPERNRCKEIQERLWKIDPRIRSYSMDVSQGITTFYDNMAKLLGHPLQRPLQKDINNKLLAGIS